jgi:ubiquitin-protein ligase
MAGLSNRALKEIKIAYESTEFDFFMDDGKYMALEPNNCYLRWTVKYGIYAGQTHILRIKFNWGSNEPKSYPKDPPNIVFLTPIWHTNVSRSGSICVDILREDQSDKQAWSPVMGINSIFQSLLILFSEHNTSSPFNGDASVQYLAAVKAAIKQKVGHEPTKNDMMKYAGSINETDIPEFVEACNHYYKKILYSGDNYLLNDLMRAPEFEKKTNNKQ